MKIPLLSLKILFFAMYLMALQQAVQAASESLEGKSVDELVVIVKKREAAFVSACNQFSAITRQRTHAAQRNSKYKPTSAENKKFKDAAAVKGQRKEAWHAAQDALSIAQGDAPGISR